MKNILVLVHDDAGQEARLQAAIDLAHALNGHLCCLDVVPMPLFVGDFAGSNGEAMLLASERELAAVERPKIEARLALEDVSWDWAETVGDAAACLERAAGLADLIVINRALDGAFAPDMRGIAGELIVHSQRPVVAVPPATRGFAASGRVMIAWDGSAAASTALRAATPLLALASDVEIIEVNGEGRPESTRDAAAYLSRHGIHPEIRWIDEPDKGPATVLLALAGSGRYAYAVMGGFGHRRWAEMMFGGVTRAMLTSSPIPVLFAH